MSLVKTIYIIVVYYNSIQKSRTETESESETEDGFQSNE